MDEKRLVELTALIHVYEATVYVLAVSHQQFMHLDDVARSQVQACADAHAKIMGERSDYLDRFFLTPPEPPEER